MVVFHILVEAAQTGIVGTIQAVLSVALLLVPIALLWLGLQAIIDLMRSAGGAPSASNRDYADRVERQDAEDTRRDAQRRGLWPADND